MAVNLVRRYDAETAHHLLNLSFAQFHADRDVVALERSSSAPRAARAPARAGGERARRRRRVPPARRPSATPARRERRGPRRIARALEALAPGDVLWVGARGREGRRARPATQRRGRRPRARRSPSRAAAPARPRRLRRAARRRSADIELPRAVRAARAARFRRGALEALRRVGRERVHASDAGDDDARRPWRRGRRASGRARIPSATPASARGAASSGWSARSRGSSAGCGAAARAWPASSTACCGVLESWGYVDGWALTPAGEMLARLYTETDLLLAEAIRERAARRARRRPRLAAVVSCFTYERRGPDGDAPTPPLRWPIEARSPSARAAIERLWRSLDADRGRRRAPADPAAGSRVHAVRPRVGAGATSSPTSCDDELTGGDFVRHVKQCIDLLRQVADVAPEPRRGAAAARTPPTRVLTAGVVAARALVGDVIRQGRAVGRPGGGTGRRRRSQGDDADLAAAVAPRTAAALRAFAPGAGSATSRVRSASRRRGAPARPCCTSTRSHVDAPTA